MVIFTIIGLASPLPFAEANTSSSHPFILQWGESGLSSPGKFSFPQNAAIDDLGNVYVTDLGNTRVQKFSNDGTFLSAWGSSGVGPGQFNSPAGIAFFNNTIYVVDTQQHRVQQFDLDGNFLSTWGDEGGSTGQFLLPSGITASEDGSIYVVDTGNQRIQKFNSDGEYILEFGDSDANGGQFVSPYGIAVDGQGNLYVSEPSKNKIFKFNSEGGYMQDFGPNFGGYPMMPQGMVIDPSGNIYVADTGHDRILRISPEGTTLNTWGSMGNEAGQFKMPKDIALDNNGHLFVVDSNGHRIQKFGSPILPTVVEPTPEETVEETETTETTESVSTLQEPVAIPGDLTKPVITPPNDLLIEATGGLTPISVGQAMAVDESGIQSLESNAPEQFPLGTTTVIWTAIDGSGNMAIATQIITVVDTIPPTITALPEITMEATNPGSNMIELEAPLASDAVGVISITSDAPETFPLGETVVTWTATDVASNSASVFQKIIVVDTKAPSLSEPADVIFEATSLEQNEIYLGEAVVIDNGEIVSITNDSPQFFGIGNTTVTWSAADSSGNVATRQQLVSVVDTESPEIISPQDIIFEATSVYDNSIPLEAPIVNDVQNVTITTNAPLVFPYGESVITWIAEDLSGNSASTTQKIFVIDTTSPTLIVPDDITVEATSVDSNTISLGNVTSDDITGISELTNNAPEVFPFGTTIVTWNATDNVGNSITSDQTVTIIDTTAPQIKAPDDILLEATTVDANTVDLGLPWVYDIIAVESFANDAPETFLIGMTTVTWTASDTSGNTASATQKVTISDTTPPSIVAPSDITVEATNVSGMPISIGEATTSDTIGIESVSNNSPDLFYLGNTTVTWTAIDSHGNNASDTQTISIVDTTAPSIVPPDDVTIEAQDAESNIVAIGVADAQDIVGVVSIENDAPESFSLGEQLITWTATDAAGNFATATQKVSVIDTTAPTITAPESVQSEATSKLNNIVELGNATASDFIGIASITSDAPEVFPLGETTVTWTATDLGGLTSTDTQIVSIVDTTPPTVSSPKIITVEATSETQNVVDYGSVFADDLVGVASIENDAPATFPFGLTTITWVVTDESGNIATSLQQISVEDTTAPTITAPNNIVLEATSSSGSVVNLGQADASDLVAISSITNNAPPTFPLGDTIVTWSVEDSSGNTANATQIVSLTDSTPPTIEIPSDIEIEAISSDENTVSLVAPLASDSVSEVIVTNNAPDYFGLGETIVTWTATDEFGNTATSSHTIIVVDTTAPELFVPEDIVIDAVSLQTPVEVGQAAAIDLANSEITITNNAPFSYPLGQTIVTWTAVDSFGNTITASQIINVQACGRADSYYNMIMGTPEDDILSGSNVADLIFALEGDDIVMGEKGNDCIFGGDGDDIIYGNEGADNITGGDGNDIIKGQAGNDVISGSFGIDVIDGGDDIDACNVNQDPDGDTEIKCES